MKEFGKAMLGLAWLALQATIIGMFIIWLAYAYVALTG